jgi:hypothetical protein
MATQIQFCARGTQVLTVHLQRYSVGRRSTDVARAWNAHTGLVQNAAEIEVNFVYGHLGVSSHRQVCVGGFPYACDATFAKRCLDNWILQRPIIQVHLQLLPVHESLLLFQI